MKNAKIPTAVLISEFGKMRVQTANIMTFQITFEGLGIGDEFPYASR